MNRRIWCFGWILVLAALLFTACGRKETTDDFFDIIVEDEPFFTQESGSDSTLLSTRYQNGEPVQLWADRKTDENGNAVMDVWRQGADGAKELLLQEINTKYLASGWLEDNEGCFYVPLGGSVAKLDSSGREVFNSTLNGIVWDMCLQPNGRILLLVGNGDGRMLTWMERNTGQISQLDGFTVEKDARKLYWDEEGGDTYLLDGQGVAALDIKKGEKDRVLDFGGTSYQFPQTSVLAFCVLSKDNVELILANGIREILKYTNLSETKTVLTLRVGQDTGDFIDAYITPLKEQAANFNKTNGEYYVVFEACGADESLDDYNIRTGVEIAAGGGADIIHASALERNVYDLLQKGAFVDLAPYMERDGIRREDYFPSAFESWELDGKVYCASTSMTSFVGFAIDSEIVGGESHPTLEKLLDSLLAYQEDALYYSTVYTPQLILRDCIHCSESLCGAVDWENSTCDFAGGLFEKVLKVAKRYGYDGEHQYPSLMSFRVCSGISNYDDMEWLESRGMAAVDAFFDDGPHIALWANSVLAINANSPNKEGAWQFIRFLLGEESQREQGESRNSNLSTVNKAVFEETALKLMEEGPLTIVPNGTRYVDNWKGSYQKQLYYQSLELSREEMIEKLWRTQEQVDEIRTAMEEARVVPLRIMPILDIIYEEAEDYFNDTKSLEEVTTIITNRVQLYLNENS